MNLCARLVPHITGITVPLKATKLRAIANPTGRAASVYAVLGVKFYFRAARVFTGQFKAIDSILESLNRSFIFPTSTLEELRHNSCDVTNSDEVRIMNDKWTTLIRRGLVVWVVIIIVEIAHGMVRQIVLEPWIGDLRARQVSILLGSTLIIAITFIFVRWLKGSSVFDFVLIGILWVGMTVGFEIVLGRFALNLSWERIASDYNMAAGGLMPLGLLVMLAAPLMIAKLYDEV